MIDSILTGSNVSPANQERLFSILTSKRDYAGLARLCEVQNLTDGIDAKLGKVNAAVVRAAWLRRTGRSKEDIAKMLRSERRVSVIVDLVDQELPKDQYELFLARSKSPKVAIAVLASDKPPTAAKMAASRLLSERYENLSWDQRARTDEFWRTSDDAASAALEVAQNIQTVSRCIPRATITRQAKVRVSKILEVATNQTVELVSRHKPNGRYYGAYEEVRSIERVVDLCSMIIAVDWCDDKVAAQINDVTDRLLASLTSDQSFQRVRDKLEELKAAASDRSGDRISQMLAAAESASDDDVAGLLETAGRIQSELGGQIIRALLMNDTLSIGTLRKVINSASYGAIRNSLLEGNYPAKTRVAFVLETPYYLQVQDSALDREAVELLLDYLHGEEIPTTVVASLMQAELTDEEIFALPCHEVYKCIYEGRASQTVIQRFGALLGAALENEPVAVWQQVDQVAAKFPGSVDAMLAMCRASNA